MRFTVQIELDLAGSHWRALQMLRQHGCLPHSTKPRAIDAQVADLLEKQDLITPRDQGYNLTYRGVVVLDEISGIQEDLLEVPSDVHRRAAAEFFGIPESEGTHEQRRHAKTVLFPHLF